jgi:hypothetical protein
MPRQIPISDRPKVRLEDQRTILRSGEYVDLVLIGNHLELDPTPAGTHRANELRGEMGTDAALGELLEDHLTNGWEFLEPAEIGALTDAPIISQDVLRNEQGDIVLVGRVFWFSNYQVEDPLETFVRDRSVSFDAVGKQIPNAADTEYWRLRTKEDQGKTVNWAAFTKKWSKKVSD